MLKDRMVRVKLRKHFQQQRPDSYVGRVTAFNDFWVVMEAKMLMMSRQQPTGVQLDAKPSAVVIPRDNIESIRVLPDSFDMNDIQFATDGQQIRMLVRNASDCFIGEMGEG